MRQACHDVTYSWREFAGTATDAHPVEKRLRIAALADNHRTIESLTSESGAAAESRCQLREAIRQHEAVRHGRFGASNPISSETSQPPFDTSIQSQPGDGLRPSRFSPGLLGPGLSARMMKRPTRIGPSGGPDVVPLGRVHSGTVRPLKFESALAPEARKVPG